MKYSNTHWIKRERAGNIKRISKALHGIAMIAIARTIARTARTIRFVFIIYFCIQFYFVFSILFTSVPAVEWKNIIWRAYTIYMGFPIIFYRCFHFICNLIEIEWQYSCGFLPTMSCRWIGWDVSEDKPQHTSMRNREIVANLEYVTMLINLITLREIDIRHWLYGCDGKWLRSND